MSYHTNQIFAHFFHQGKSPTKLLHSKTLFLAVIMAHVPFLTSQVMLILILIDVFSFLKGLNVPSHQNRPTL